MVPLIIMRDYTMSKTYRNQEWAQTVRGSKRYNSQFCWLLSGSRIGTSQDSDIIAMSGMVFALAGDVIAQPVPEFNE